MKVGFSRSLFLCCGMLVLLITCECNSAFAQLGKVFQVSGYIGEETGQRPKKAISGADLRLDPTKAKSESNAAGNYMYKAIPGDRYELTVKADGYRAITRIIDVQKDTIEDFFLWPLNPAKELYDSVASKAVKESKQSKAGYSPFWMQLRADAFPPVEKYWLVKGINEHDPEAKLRFKPLGSYLMTTAEAVAEANERFKTALVKQEKIPTPTTLAEKKVGEEVVIDIVIYQLRTTPVSMARKQQFLIEFSGTWKGTDKDVRLWLPRQ